MAEDITSTGEGQNVDTLATVISVSTRGGKSEVDRFYESLESIKNILDSIDSSLKTFQNSINSLDISKIQKVADDAKKLTKITQDSSIKRESTWVKQMNADKKRIDDIKSHEKKYKSSEKPITIPRVPTPGEKPDIGDNSNIRVHQEYELIEENSEKIAKNSQKASKAWSSIGHMLKYRAISTAINLINKGLSEGIKNVALFDDKFNATISNIQSSANRLTNQTGAFAATFIENYEHLITGVLDGFSNIMDYFTQVMAVVNGKTQYRKAIKNAEDFAKGMRKAYSGIGIDELNVFGERQQEKFEFADVSKFAKETAGIVTSLASAGAGLLIFKKAAKWITPLLKSDLLSKTNKNLSGISAKLPKVAAGLGLFAGGALSARDAGKKLAQSLSSDNKSGLGGSFLGLVGGAVAGAAGGYLVGGPIGAAVGGILSFTTGLVSCISESEKLARSNAIKDFFSNAGESIESVQGKLDNFYKSLGSDVAREYTEKLVTLRDNVSDANLGLESFLNQLSVSDNIDLSDIEKLTEKFNALAESAKELNNWNRDNFFKVLSASISVLPADKLALLGDVFSSISEATKSLNQNIDNASAEFKKLVEGGLTSDNIGRVRELAQQIYDNTYNPELQGAMRAVEQINFGSTEEEIKSNISNLQNQINTEISSIEKAYEDMRDYVYFLNKKGQISQSEFSNINAVLDEAEKSVISSMRQKLSDTLETGMLSYVDSWVKKIQEETGKTISRSEMLKTLQSYAGKNTLNAIWDDVKRNWGAESYRNFQFEDVSGYHQGAVGIADMFSEILGLQAEQLQVSQDEAWRRMIDNQSKEEEKNRKIFEGQLKSQESIDKKLDDIKEIASKETTIIISEEAIARAEKGASSKYGRTMNKVGIY